MGLARLKAYLFDEQFVLIAVATFSLFSLVMALFAEVALGLEPCILCIYQRIPFLLALVLSVFGLILKRPFWPLVISAFGFLINSGIAFYHSGVERKWWGSVLEGCSVPDFGETPDSILENILSAPTGNCAEIPWADPFLGLSMANYNIVFSFFLFFLCVVSIVGVRLLQNITKTPK